MTPRERAASDLDERWIVNGRGKVIAFPRNRRVDSPTFIEVAWVNHAAIDMPWFCAVVMRSRLGTIVAWLKGGRP